MLAKGPLAPQTVLNNSLKQYQDARIIENTIDYSAYQTQEAQVEKVDEHEKRDLLFKHDVDNSVHFRSWARNSSAMGPGTLQMSPVGYSSLRESS